MAELLAVSH